MLMRRFRLDGYLILLLVLSLPALAPLLAPGYFYDAHDGRHTVFYLSQFDASLRDGAWWPRWAMHHIQGYGYPTFLIQAPLGFYLGEVFVLSAPGLHWRPNSPGRSACWPAPGACMRWCATG